MLEKTLSGPPTAEVALIAHPQSSASGETSIVILGSALSRDSSRELQASIPDSAKVLNEDEVRINGSKSQNLPPTTIASTSLLNIKTEETVEQKGTPRTRKPRPNAGYIQLYKHYTEKFFDLEYLERSKKSSLKPSKITTQRAFYFPRHRTEKFVSKPDNSIDPELESLDPENKGGMKEYDISSLPGSWWTSNEKDIFFRCLARFTIHRIEEFRRYIPGKTEPEIMMYYNLLKRELARVKRTKRVEVTFEDYPRAESDASYSVTHTYESRSFRGASYSNLPIAHELSEEWIEYEDYQSSLLGPVTDAHQNRKELAKRNRILEETGKHLEKAKEEGDLTLIYQANALQLSQIFRKNSIYPCTSIAKVRLVNADVLLLLDEFVRQKVREIIGTIIAAKASGKREEASSATTITSKEVIWACDMLKMFETPKSGTYSKGRDGKTPSLETYWQNIALSLGLNIDSEGENVTLPDSNRIETCEKLPQQRYPPFHISVTKRNMSSEHCCPEYDIRSVDFTSRGVITDTDHENSSLETDGEKNLQSIKWQDLPVAQTLPKKRGFEDVLVEEMCFVQETSALKISDSQRDTKQLADDLSFFTDDERPPAVYPREVIDMDELYNIRLWGLTNIEKLCPQKLRDVWDHSFSEY